MTAPNRPSGEVNLALAEVFDVLDRAEVRWCLLRRPTNLAVPTGDIDLLVDRSDLQQVADLVRARAFARLPQFNRNHSFVRYDVDNDAWLWLDIATDLAFGSPPLATGAERQCLDRRRRTSDGLWSAPNDAFWMVLLHAAIDGRPLAPRHRERLRRVAQEADRAGGVLADFATRLLPGDQTQHLLVDSVRREDWPAVQRGLRALRRGARAQAVSQPLPALNAAAQWIARRLPSPRRHGMSVALIGPDGVGKSTLATALTSSFIVPTRLIYMGVWRTPAPLRLLGGPGRVGHAIVVQWMRWTHGALHRLRGRLVIFDRYTEEHLSPRTRRSRLGRLLQSARSLAACPAPDLVLLLDTPGAVAFARKGEHSPEEIERIRDRYRRSLTRFPRRVVLDAQQPADMVRRQATAAIWTSYRRRLQGEPRSLRW